MVISDTGYVCSASVLKGLSKDIDSNALESVRKWHFRPALKDGQPVPVSAELFVTVDLNGNPEPLSTVKPWALAPPAACRAPPIKQVSKFESYPHSTTQRR